MGINGLSEKDLKDLAALYLSCNEKREEIDPQTAGIIIFEMMLRRCHEFGDEIELKSVSPHNDWYDKCYISKNAKNDFVYIAFSTGDNIDHLPSISVFDNEKISAIEFAYNGCYEYQTSSEYPSNEYGKNIVRMIQAKIAKK